jgi:hypothetical protein
MEKQEAFKYESLRKFAEAVQKLLKNELKPLKADKKKEEFKLEEGEMIIKNPEPGLPIEEIFKNIKKFQKKLKE